MKISVTKRRRYGSVEEKLVSNTRSQGHDVIGNFLSVNGLDYRSVELSSNLLSARLSDALANLKRIAKPISAIL